MFLAEATAIRDNDSFSPQSSMLCLLSFLALLIAAVSAAKIRFALEITSADIDPAGIGPRKGILVNGTFPAPKLRVHEGDEVEFIVHNRMRVDTAVHFHGIVQGKSPWSDGVPGVTQRAIRPGASFRYQWTADEAGVYFYHAHERGQIMDGLYGAIVVTAPESVERPFHLIAGGRETEAIIKAEREIQPLLVSDWTQFTFEDFYDVEETANVCALTSFQSLEKHRLTHESRSTTLAWTPSWSTEW